MPAGYSFSQLEIPDGKNMFIAQTDVKDYFYSIGMPRELRPFFALPAVDLRRVIPNHPLCGQRHESGFDAAPCNEGGAHGLELGNVHRSACSSTSEHACRWTYNGQGYWLMVAPVLRLQMMLPLFPMPITSTLLGVTSTRFRQQSRSLLGTWNHLASGSMKNKKRWTRLNHWVSSLMVGLGEFIQSQTNYRRFARF